MYVTDVAHFTKGFIAYETITFAPIGADTNLIFGLVSQLAEETDLKSVQCEFESHQGTRIWRELVYLSYSKYEVYGFEFHYPNYGPMAKMVKATGLGPV